METIPRDAKDINEFMSSDQWLTRVVVGTTTNQKHF